MGRKKATAAGCVAESMAFDVQFAFSSSAFLAGVRFAAPVFLNLAPCRASAGLGLPIHRVRLAAALWVGEFRPTAALP